MEALLEEFAAAIQVFRQIQRLLRAHGIGESSLIDPFRLTKTKLEIVEQFTTPHAKLTIQLTMEGGELLSPVVYPVRICVSVALVCGPLIRESPDDDGVIVVKFSPRVSRWEADEYGTLAALPRELRLENNALPGEVHEEADGDAEERWRQRLPATEIALLHFINNLVGWFARQNALPMSAS